MSEFDLVSSSIAQVPAGASFDDNRSARFLLKNFAPVQRLALKLNEPTVLADFDTLSFELSTPDTPDLRPSIIRGDIAMPEVRLTNDEGVIFRFKRGNMKDFFDINQPEKPQTINLPLAAFIFDTDLKTNPKPVQPFLERPIIKVDLDFLPDPDREFDIIVSNPKFFRSKNQTSFNYEVTELVRISSNSNFFEIPLYYTESIVTGYASRLTPLGRRLFPLGFKLDIFVRCPDGKEYSRDVTVDAKPGYFNIRAEDPGQYDITYRLFDQRTGELVSQSYAMLARGLRGINPPGSIMGISDGFGYERSSRFAGQFQRRPTSLQMFDIDRRDEGLDIDVNFGKDVLPRVSSVHGQELIVSIKKLPYILSSRQDVPDYGRYPPKNMADYREVLKHFRDHLVERQAAYVEVWNEASTRYEWMGDMDQLIEMHQVSQEVFEGTGIKVLGCGTHALDMDFIARFLAADGWKFCDGLAVHAYTYQPTEFREDVKQMVAMLEEIERRENQKVPDIYFTETGFRTPAFSNHEQAYLQCAFTVISAAEARVKSFIWFRFQNQNPEFVGAYDQTMSSGYAMVGYGDAYVRPALAAYVFLNRLLSAYSFAEQNEVENSMLQLSFGTPQSGFSAILTEDLRPGCQIPDLAEHVVVDVYGRKLTAEEIQREALCYVLHGKAVQAFLGD